MVNEPPKTIKVTADSSLAKLLRDAAGSPILLERNGELCRLERMEQEGTPPTPSDVTRSKEGILKAAGKAYIKERRQTANRPSVKL
jgi:hypothetical protein